MREVYIKYYELFFDNTENHLDNLDTIEETLSGRLLEVFSQIYTQENMNNLVSKKICNFFNDSNPSCFLGSVENMGDKLDTILMSLYDIDWVTESFIEELFQSKTK